MFFRAPFAEPFAALEAELVKLTAADKGVVSTSVRVTRNKKATLRVKTVYSGSSSYAGDSTASKRVRTK